MSELYAKIITDGGDGSLFYPNHGAIVAKWQDTDIDIALINMALYALDGWNGEKYLHCWRCKDRFTADQKDADEGREYEIIPVYDWDHWNEEEEQFQTEDGEPFDGIIDYWIH